MRNQSTRSRIATYVNEHGLGAHSTHTQVLYVTIPSRISAGTWYVGVIIDADEELTEIRETNKKLVLHECLQITD